MEENITREFFEKRKKEIYDKWTSKASQIPKDSKAALRFYHMNKFEIYQDLEELWDLSTSIHLKGE